MMVLEVTLPICRLTLLVVLLLTPRGFSLGILAYPSTETLTLINSEIFKFQFDQGEIKNPFLDLLMLNITILNSI